MRNNGLISTDADVIRFAVLQRCCRTSRCHVRRYILGVPEAPFQAIQTACRRRSSGVSDATEKR